MCLVAAWLVVAACAFAADSDDVVPARPDPPRLVNDLAGILGDEARENEAEHPAVDTGFEEETRERIPGPVITGEEIRERSKG